MLRAITVDDESGGRETLNLLITKLCPEISIIDSIDSVRGAIESINKHKPDLLFLDIELQEGTGFNILEAIDHESISVIFTTAYSEYAVKAFKYNAIDYLLKPIDARELINAVNRVLTQRQKNLLTSPESIHNLIRSFAEEQGSSKLYINSAESILSLEIDKIVHLEADGSYTHIYLLNGEKITATKNLKDFEHTLDNRLFVRVHQSHLVNIQHIKKFVKTDGGYLIMSDGTTIEVSARKRADILARLQN